MTGEPNFYLYAVCKSTVVNTFKAQQDAEREQTGKDDFRREERYVYDPAYENEDGASAVWQFQEYAAHRVETSEVLGCFKVDRRTLVPPGNGESVAIAGIQFRLEFFRSANFSRRSDRRVQRALLADAKGIAARYESFYPEEGAFLSYMGTVQPVDDNDLPQTLSDAPEKVQQVDAVVTQGVFDGDTSNGKSSGCG